TITANVRDDRLQEFFGQDNIDYSTINSTTMSIVLDSNLLLNKLTISYKSNIIDTPIQTTIDIAVQQSSRGEKLLVMDTSQVLLLIISILLLVTISFVAYKLYSQNSKK
ncbi:MAG: hypothetical protein FWF58_01085, partial [Firmicutes bacterium]|nr:hypothetical protein [Bacillota bacterium]